MVTVVDTANFMGEYSAAEDLQDRGESLGEDDHRTVTDLLIDQIEFADVIVLNKLDLVTDEEALEVKAVVTRAQPRRGDRFRRRADRSRIDSRARHGSLRLRQGGELRRLDS